MANYATLKAAIDAVIKANGQREITGTVLNQTLNAMVNSLGANYQLAGVATPSTNPGTPDQNVFYLAFEAGTYTNFNATVLSAGISILMWNGSWSSQTFYTIDATPTASSNNLVSSGAVFDAIKTDGSAYDVSAHFPTGGPNNDGKFTLEYILSNANTLIPTAWRKGGMSIRFVSSIDNNYVQYRLMADEFTTDTTQWQGVDNEPALGSSNLIKSGGVKFDSDNKNQIVYGIKSIALYNGHLNASGAIVNYNNNKFFVVKVRSGDVINITAPTELISYAVLKSFNPFETLPYTPDFVSGVSGFTPIYANKNGNFIIPSDGNYVIVSCNAPNYLYPIKFAINGIDIIEPLVPNLNFKWKDIESLNTYGYTHIINFYKEEYGHLQGGSEGSDGPVIVRYSSAKHIAIRVNPNDTIYIKVGENNTAIAFVKDYDVYKATVLPYQLESADGSVTATLIKTQGTYTVPANTKYMILATATNTGASRVPSILKINGLDILKSLADIINESNAGVDSKIQTVDEKYYGKIMSDFYTPVLSNIVEVNGHLNYSGGNLSIVNYGQSKHIAVKVNVGDKVKIISNSDVNTAIAFVKGYSIYDVQTLPYAPEDANGDGLIDITSDTTYTVPANTEYMVIRTMNNAGVSSFPSLLLVNGYDITKSIAGILNREISPFTQLFDLKVTDVLTNAAPGGQGMCTIDNVICSCGLNYIKIKQDGDTIYGTRQKTLRYNNTNTLHNNDVDYCKYSDALITSMVKDDFAEGETYHANVLLLPGAKNKLYSNDGIVQSDWVKYELPSDYDSFSVVGNAFGENCTIIYVILIPNGSGYNNNYNKHILKIKLGFSNGVYDGTYDILWDKKWTYRIEIQGSKYCNGKLFVSTDWNYGTTPKLHAAVTTVDVDTLQTVEHVSYVDSNEAVNYDTEAEGLTFLGEKIYQVVTMKLASDHTQYTITIREYDRFNL